MQNPFIKNGKSTQFNVLGTALEPCSSNPMTGYFRDSYCHTVNSDYGSHTVAVELTSQFLEFSKSLGNDLSTPKPEYNFPGLNEGDRWCLCASRWQEAFEVGMAPKVMLKATNRNCLDKVKLEDL